MGKRILKIIILTSVLVIIYVISVVSFHNYTKMKVQEREKILIDSLLNIQKSRSEIKSEIPFRKNIKGNHDVFITGVDDCKATYWINGEQKTIGNGLSGTNIFVTENDIYVTLKKCTYNHSNWFWKNGKITSTKGEIHSIFVDGSDFYLAGQQDGNAVYWKNGELFTILLNAKSNSIFVKDGNVYVAITSLGIGHGAKYWTNGTIISLDKGYNANSIFVHNNDVYVAGSGWDESGGSPEVAKYWKNGEEINLAKKAEASSIFCSGDDVYVAGRKGGTAIYWKNGIAIALTDGQFYSGANSIFVDGSDVYVAGYELGFNGEGGAKYWKNGVMHRLNNHSHDINSVANSIVVR